jgi:hypothetical protein
MFITTQYYLTFVGAYSEINCGMRPDAGFGRQAATHAHSSRRPTANLAGYAFLHQHVHVYNF